MKGFGLDRVIEPKGNVPVTAWKLDNSKKLKSKELRIAVDLIDFERGNFNQICSICQYDETKIKERILKIVNERNKLHNPYTESSGLFTGIIEEISPDFEIQEGLCVGDQVVCLTPLAGLPLYIEEITAIDINYAQIECKGYAICFESVQLFKQKDFVGNDVKYLMKILEEEGSLCNISEELKHMNVSKALIIGPNPIEAIFYARIAYDIAPGKIENIIVTDKSYAKLYDTDVVKKAFGDLMTRIYFVDLSMPMDAFSQLLEGENRKLADVVVNLENIKGSETVANCIVKDSGMVCYTDINNSYAQGLLIADCFGKQVDHYALDGYEKDAYEFAVKLVNKVKPNLDILSETLNKVAMQKSFVNMKNHEITRDAVQKIDDFIYMSPVTKNMLEEVINVAKYDCNVIIQGETGVGKEKVFDLIHQNSPRSGKPCIKINCATIHENLAESEFFGYEKGSFTGAQESGKKGYFELANNGTLFLDEIGSLSLSMQSKLLRVLQESTYYKVGGVEPKHVNVRVICANNIPLKKLVNDGAFREDLYYRLNICMINVAPLRMRKEDIVCLAESFLESYSKKYGINKTFSNGALEELQGYHWPGNVRELENTVHRLYISEKENEIDRMAVDMLINESIYEFETVDIRKEFSSEENMDLNSIMDKQEKKLIEFALKKCKTTRAAAEFLNIPQATFARKKLKYNL